MTTPPPGTQSEAAQDLIEVRLKRAAEVAPVRIVTDYAMSSTSTPIRSVMLEAAQELATLRAALAPPADVAGEVEDEIRARHRRRLQGVTLDTGAPIEVTDVADLLRLLSEERARRVEVEGALATMTDCQRLPKVYKYTGTAEVDVENMFDVGHRHRSGKQPRDYLMSWLSMFRPFAYATKDDSWGELEKLISIVMNNYVQILAKAEKLRATHKDTQDE